jgi:hypothetical protein
MVMRKARDRGSFYQLSKNIRHRGYILVGSIVSSTMLSAAAGLANPALTSPTQTTARANYGGSLGQSLLNSMLGANALGPQNSATSVTPTRTTQPTIGGCNPQLVKQCSWLKLQPFLIFKETGHRVLLKPWHRGV